MIFPVIGVEQILHATPAALSAVPLYDVLHWLSDALLALPLGLAAVWAGHRIANRLGIGAGRIVDVYARACLIALVLTTLLVPGWFLHNAIDQLTHANTVLAAHAHPPAAATLTGIPPPAVEVAHAFIDGLLGQVVGLPATFAMLLWKSRDQTRAVTFRLRTRIHKGV